MDPKILNQFCGDWFREWEQDVPIGWATDLLFVSVDKNPEEAWSLILELIARSPDDEGLGKVAAGPLEDLLSQHGDLFISRVEIEAHDPRFLACLTQVWGHERFAPHIYERVQAVTREQRA